MSIVCSRHLNDPQGIANTWRRTRLRAAVRGAALPLLVLAACAADPDAPAAPDLRLVPERPVPAETAEERALLLESLLIERERALYEARVARHRSSLDPEPPGPPPPEPLPAALPVELLAPPAAVEEMDWLDAEVDDGSLSSFLREMTREQLDPAPFADPAP
jgi:hypothetical protein